jgi:nitrogen regulatory protein PII
VTRPSRHQSSNRWLRPIGADSCDASVNAVRRTFDWHIGGNDSAARLRNRVSIDHKTVDKVIETITLSAKTGKIGDGKIFVYGLDHAVRIRTGETDADAI